MLERKRRPVAAALHFTQVRRVLPSCILLVGLLLSAIAALRVQTNRGKGATLASEQTVRLKVGVIVKSLSGNLKRSSPPRCPPMARQRDHR
jgi:hypothetical protein